MDDDAAACSFPRYRGPMPVPGPLLATGRDADVFEYGPRLVLRRSREGRSMAAEARIMDYVRSQGYPVPAVDRVSEDGSDLVMERVYGVDMVAAMSRRPWTIPSQGRLLADLHLRLHELPAPDWLSRAAVGVGDRIVHLDLHPLNVILSPTRGPVVIDWPNTRRGDPAVDVALTWVLMACGSVPAGRIVGGILGRVRSVLVKSFLGAFELDEVRARLRDVVAWKVGDPHMSPVETAAMWRIVDAYGGGVST